MHAFHSLVLPNGLSVHADQIDQPFQIVCVVVHSGAYHDPVGREGVASFVQRLVMMNTSYIPYLVEPGVRMELKTHYRYVSYQFLIPEVCVLSDFLDMLGHIFLQLRLEVDWRIDEIRKNMHQDFIHDLVESTYQKYGPYEVYIAQQERKALYTGTKSISEYLCGVHGDPALVDQITQHDLQAFYDTYYTPANMSIVGVGGVSLKDMVAALSQGSFAQEKQGKRTPRQDPSTDVSSPSENTHMVQLPVCKDGTQPIGFYKTVAKMPIIPALYLSVVIRLIEYTFCLKNQDDLGWIDNFRQSFFTYRHAIEYHLCLEYNALMSPHTLSEIVNECIIQVDESRSLIESLTEDIRSFSRNNAQDRRLVEECCWASSEYVCDQLGCNQQIRTILDAIAMLESMDVDDIQRVTAWLAPEKRWTCILQPPDAV